MDNSHHNSEIYSSFIEKACAFMLELDTSGNLAWVSPWTAEFFGYHLEELIGQPILGTLAPRTESTGRDLEAMFRRFYEFPQDFVTNINENRKKDGELVWVAWSNRAIFDEEGWIAGFLSIGVEITNEQHDLLLLRKENTLLKSTLNAFDDAFFVTNLNGQPQAYSKPFKALFPESEKAFNLRSSIELFEVIAESVRDEDSEIFRQAAGAALMAGGDLGEEDFVQGKIILINKESANKFSWQARSRRINGVYEGLLWVFRPCP